MIYIIQLLILITIIWLFKKIFDLHRAGNTSQAERKIPKIFLLIPLLNIIFIVSIIWIETYIFLIFVIYIAILIIIGQRQYGKFSQPEITITSPKASQKYKIVFLSDFHFDKNKKKFNEQAMQNLIDNVPLENVDLILLGGDYVNYQEHIDIFTNYLKMISLKIPTIAIYGNHDFEKMEQWEIAFKRINIQTIGNGNIVVNDDLVISGVEDLWTGNPNYNISKIDLPNDKVNILLTHNPDYIDQIENKNYYLALAGHYHAGQFNIIPGVKLNALITKYPYGKYIVDNKPLYVASGVGGTLFRGRIGFYSRIGSRPEITIINVEPGESE